ncbi:MFS gliotoxin efflux transporter GliA [Talaromyces islandicus]|uniref:MFS gliotoxin efflux transporter GliA n=1 Tax=Talaromyces islandicus TaxID=28573 RepID=A0A0U1LJV6_TALIS|nr:MFS gliotoxin efflux transporter GliA [Talaromyces islandicus]
MDLQLREIPRRWNTSASDGQTSGSDYNERSGLSLKVPKPTLKFRLLYVSVKLQSNFSSRHPTWHQLQPASGALIQIVTGISIGALKLFNSLLILGGILSTIASGLLTTIQADSGHPAWIGYQVFAWIGLGLCFNVYIIIIQNMVTPDEVPTATAILLCGALVVSAAHATFHNKLIQTLAVEGPEINPSTVFSVGASDIQKTFHNNLSAIDASYMEGLHKAFALAIAVGDASTLVAVAQPWLRLQASESAEKTEAAKTIEDGKADNAASSV